MCLVIYSSKFNIQQAAILMYILNTSMARKNSLLNASVVYNKLKEKYTFFMHFFFYKYFALAELNCTQYIKYYCLKTAIFALF